jgi:hypothetical protein
MGTLYGHNLVLVRSTIVRPDRVALAHAVQRTVDREM